MNLGEHVPDLLKGRGLTAIFVTTVRTARKFQSRFE
jgi:hypothetical protein